VLNYTLGFEASQSPQSSLIGDVNQRGDATMQKPLELTFREVPHTQKIEDLINEKVQKLESVCDNIISCRVVVECPHRHHQNGNPYQIRIDLMVPLSHEIVVKKETTQHGKHDHLTTLIRDSFEAARRQLLEHMRIMRNEVKTHSDPKEELASVNPEEEI